MNKQKKATLEELMSTEETAAVKADDKTDSISLDEPKRRPWLVLLFVVIALLLAVAGGYVAWRSYKAGETLKTEEKIETPVVENTEEKESAKLEEITVYTSATEGLNFRKEANAEAEILAIIPYGTKLVVIETSGDWYKVEYDNKTGWIAKLYTSDTNPLVYKSDDYGFEMTFPATWAYKLFPAKATPVVTATYYVALPTSDTSINESSLGVDLGYSSLFAISVYTPSQWDTMKAYDGPKPVVAVQNADYVITYSLPNGIPANDLAARLAETKSVIATIKF
jgi:uncharacterized protein YgiM (DUF1202 family)